MLVSESAVPGDRLILGHHGVDALLKALERETAASESEA